MNWLLAAIGIWLIGGVGAALAGSSPKWATRLGVSSAVLGSVAGMAPVLSVLIGGASSQLLLPWSVPSGSLALGLDGLSAFFLMPTLILTGLAAVYGGEYLLSYRTSKNLGIPWFLYTWMTAGMVLVFLARNAVLFLAGWEVMTLSAAFLVTFDDEKNSVRSAGWIYLVASQIATAFLLVFFIVLGRESSSLDFAWFTNGSRSAFLSGFLFLCALIGFGTKAGIMPFHVWLPEAHPAAPSHVSAVMSGLILNTGVYGLFRGFTFLGGFQEWWGWALMGLGLVSAAFGILFALAQHDLKRLLAYSSVENIGIIFIGMGMGVLGVCRGSPILATMGFCGAFLHVLNHSLAKGMLFLNAGALLHATGTRRFNLLGGLSKKLPLESALFLIGSVILCALPPLSGFISEFWIYLGAFGMRSMPGPGMVMSSLVLLASLALVGGLAAVAFSKAFGSAYLGHPRQTVDENFHRPGWAMRIPMIILTALCLAMAPLFPWIAGLTAPMVAQLSGFEVHEILGQISVVQNSLWSLLIFAGSLILLAGILVGVRWVLLRRREIGEGGTWDCGYSKPSRRMQYSGTSFSQPVVNFFSLILQGRKMGDRPDGLFPRTAPQSTLIPDLYLEKVYRPFFLWIESRLSRWRLLQHGRVQFYVLYVAMALLALLIWKLGTA